MSEGTKNLARSREVSPLGRKVFWNRGPLWLLPVIILVSAGILLSLMLFKLSGGKEIADDAKCFIKFAHDPLVLWRDYAAAGFSNTWGSFPPMLPPIFSALVYPWLKLGSDFWAIRLGVLSWSIVALFALFLSLHGERELSQDGQRRVLLLFSVVPSLLLAIAFIPQEEIYVSIFSLALYVAGRERRWGVAWLLFLFAAFAGKYFLLVLAVPLALASPAPAKNFLLWGSTSCALLAGYVGYHKLLHGLTPILSYVIEPGSSISVWALVWNLGLKLDPRVVQILSLVLAASGILAFGFVARRRGLPLVFSMAGTLYITFLCLSTTTPAYVLWNLPLVLICIAYMASPRRRALMIASLFLWGAGEWGANFFRGVKLALDTVRPEGKTAVAKLAEHYLGSAFPYRTFQVACVALVIASGLFQLGLLWASGREDRRVRETSP